MFIEDYESLHRAKDVENGEWVKGFYCRVGNIKQERNYIIPSYAGAFSGIEVDVNTLCPSFMYGDDSGNTIYDKDIIEFKFEDSNVPIGNGRFERRRGETERYLIQWIDEGQEFVATPLDGSDIGGNIKAYFYNLKRDNCPFSAFILMITDMYGHFRPEYGGHIKIIGNAFDNPELLTGHNGDNKQSVEEAWGQQQWQMSLSHAEI